MVLLYLSDLLLTVLILIAALSNLANSTEEDGSKFPTKIDAVMLTTGKDTRVFVKSIASALKHLVDVDKFYIISPNLAELKKNLGNNLNDRMILLDERKFPFGGYNVSEVMIESVRQRGVYPLDGNSKFEKTVKRRVSWYLQQLLKFYAGRVFGLNDYVLLDSDLVWFKDLELIAPHSTFGHSSNTYYYATSNQYHRSYIATLSRISGLPLHNHQPMFRSGIVHHMVIVKTVLESLINVSEAKHGIPFWQILLNIR